MDRGDRMNRPSRLTLSRHQLAIGFVVALLGKAITAHAGPVSVTPQEIRFDDAFARRQLVVSRDGSDVTRDAKYRSADPAVARVDAMGGVVPVAPPQPY